MAKEKENNAAERRQGSTKYRDSSSKLIFKDPVLCSQFLRGYADIPALKDVRPEDIEDVTERYVHLFTEERNSDVVKKIYFKNNAFYLVSLIEHKSDVDYNTIMQVFRYITFIWEDYEKEQEKMHPGISRTKEFRYPPVLPVVFYHGAGNWTAAARLHERVLFSDVLGKYIPDYQCVLVQLRDYSNAELFTEQIKERKVGELFKHFEGWDIQAARRELKEAKEEAEKEVNREAERGIQRLLKVIKELSGSQETAVEKLVEEYGLTEENAEEKIALYW